MLHCAAKNDKIYHETFSSIAGYGFLVNCNCNIFVIFLLQISKISLRIRNVILHLLLECLNIFELMLRADFADKFHCYNSVIDIFVEIEQIVSTRPGYFLL